MAGRFARLVLAVLLGVCTCAQLAQGQEVKSTSAQDGPPVPIELYLSETDAEAPAIRRSVDEVLKTFPRLKLREINIDTAEGRAAREAMEAEHRIRDPGEATLCIGPYHLVNRATDTEIQTYFLYLAARIFDPAVAKGRLTPDPLPFARKVFGDAVRLSPLSVPDLEGQRVFSVLDGDRTVGLVADLYSATHCPFCNDTQFLIAVQSGDLAIRAVEPVRSIERYGKDISAEESATYLKKWLGRAPQTDPDAQVDAVVGATRTCGAYRQVIQGFWKTLLHEKPEGVESSQP